VAESKESVEPGLGCSAYTARFSGKSEVQVHILGIWQEAMGVLEGVDLARGIVSFKGFNVAVPPGVLERLPELEMLRGERVALLRTDLRRHPIIVRKGVDAGARGK